MVPETVEPLNGEEIETVGGVVSAGAKVVNVWLVEVAKLPAASLDLTWYVYVVPASKLLPRLIL